MTQSPSKPLVSIITPCLNGSRFLAHAVESVQAQTCADWELLIVDDGSDDGSDTQAKQLAVRDPRIVPLRTRGRVGAGAARNLGLSAARGRYVAFLDCDDWWAPTKLAEQIDVMRRTTAGFCVSPYWVCDASGRPHRVQHVLEPLTLRRYLMKRCVIGCLTVVVDVDAIGPFEFRPHLRKAEDFVLWVELLRRCDGAGRRVALTLTPLAYYRVHEAGQSRSKLQHARAHWHAYRHELGLSLPSAIFYFGTYVVNGLLDRLPVSASLRPWS